MPIDIVMKENIDLWHYHFSGNIFCNKYSRGVLG